MTLQSICVVTWEVTLVNNFSGKLFQQIIPRGVLKIFIVFYLGFV